MEDWSDRWIVEFTVDGKYISTNQNEYHFRIMATVIEIVEAFIEEVHPKAMKFTTQKEIGARHDRRGKIYQNIIKRRMNRYNYDVKVAPRQEVEGYSFIITRK